MAYFDQFGKTTTDFLTLLLISFQAELGFNMYLLDIGGGFPGSEDVKLKFEEVQPC